VTITLAERNLDGIAALGVAVPGYERESLTPRILHVGVGGFHRAHMALYTDDVAASDGGWAIRGVGLLDADRRMADALGRQDCLYTLVERDNEGSRPRVVGSIVDYDLVAGHGSEFSRLVADPGIAILSLTITEGGYSLAGGNPTLEAIVSGLDARRADGGGPLTILSCDNLPDNGAITSDAVKTIAADRKVELLHWIETSCTFPTSMVDRITPQTRDEDVQWLRDDVGIDDAWPVVCESFRQWVIEDDFAAGRPPWEEAGALFTDRVHDWELYKLRMLNASHSCMAYLAALAHIEFVDEAIAVPAIRQYLERFLSTEAIPTLAEIPGHPAREYADTVFRRLENANVRDQIARVCIDGASKFPTFLIPTIETQLDRGGPVACAALALAGWARYLATVPDRAPDVHGDAAAPYAVASLQDPAAFLGLDLVFTPKVRDSERFRDAFVAASRELADRGPIAALEALAVPA